MLAQTVISVLALVAISSVNAIQVTNPTMNTVWNSAGSQTLSWQAVATDPTDFLVVLVNQQGFLPNGPVTLIQSQSTGSPNVQNSATVTYPSGNWPTGYGFQINLMSSSTYNAAILAQSPQFNISSNGGAAGASVTSTSSGSSSSSSASSTLSTPTTLSRSSTVSNSATITGSAVSSAASGDASGGIPNAPTSSRSGATNLVLPGATILSLGALVAFFL